MFALNFGQDYKILMRKLIFFVYVLRTVFVSWQMRLGKRRVKSGMTKGRQEQKIENPMLFFIVIVWLYSTLY